jgi:hypothetical protein
VQEVLEAGFEGEAVPEDEIGIAHRGDVGAGLPVEMRVDALAHQRPDRGALARDVARHVGDLARGRDDAQRFGGGRPGEWQGGGKPTAASMVRRPWGMGSCRLQVAGGDSLRTEVSRR